MKNSTLLDELDQFPFGAKVTATTPHGTYTFDIDGVEQDDKGDAVLKLVEVPA